MPVKLIAPLYKTMTLERTDERYGNDGEPTTVVIRQAAQHEHEQRQQQFSTLKRSYNELAPSEVTVIQDIPMELLKRLEVWLTLCECNLLDENGEDMFPSTKGKNGHPKLKMTRREFDNAWGKLPPDIAGEIHEKVLEVNFVWSGRQGEEL